MKMWSWAGVVWGVFSILAFSGGPLLAAFSDVTVSSGIGLDGGGAYGAAWGDYDNDGDDDLYVTRRGTAGLKKSALYRNEGNGRFTEVTDAAFPDGGASGAWGTAWGDYDNDGDLDLYVARREGEEYPNILYRNNGNGTFANVAGETGAAGGTIKPSRSVSWGDYDGDGWLDLHVANNGVAEGSGISDFLFHNIPGPSKGRKLVDMASNDNIRMDNGNGLSYTGLWSDYDNDGDLDLFVAIDFHGLELFRNDGGWPSGRFTRMTKDAFPGQLVDSLGPPTPAVNCIRDSDGHYIDRTRKGHVHCLKDEPTLHMTPPYGALPYNAMGICAGDYNNDGFMDYYVTNFVVDQYQRASSIADDDGKLESALWHNNGDGTFTERARAAGLNPLKNRNPRTDELRDPNGTVLFSIQEQENIEWGCNFFDYDNDGDLDLYAVSGDPPGLRDPAIIQRDSLYRNNGDGTFTDVTLTEISEKSGDGTSSDGEASGYGSAVADMDDDGDLDLFVANQSFGSSRLYRNDQRSGHHWLKLKLVGKTQKFGIGARVEVKIGETVRIREVIAGSSYLSMDSLTQHFGLGTALRVDEIRVRWPNGVTRAVLNQATDQTLVIREGCDADPTDTLSPTMPEGLTTIPSGAGHIKLRWKASADNQCVLGYRIYRGEIPIATAPTPSYQDDGLNPDTEYCYRIAAVDSSGNESAASRPSCSTTPVDRTPPSLPIGLTVAVLGPDRVNLTWGISFDDAGVVGYQVYRNGVRVATPVVPSYQDVGLQSGSRYCYAVRAVDGAGNVSEQSHESCAHPRDLVAPTPPMGLAFSLTKPTQVDLNWEPSTDNVGIAKYQIYRDGVLVGEPDVTHFRDKDLSPAVIHTYIVVAVDEAGNISLPSEAVRVTAGEGDKARSWCLITAAAFGSPLEPHIRLLREFRDRFLSPFPYGHAVVRSYGRYSPTLAKVIVERESLALLVRLMLLPFIGLAWLFLKAAMGVKLGMLITLLGVEWMVRQRRRVSAPVHHRG